MNGAAEIGEGAGEMPEAKSHFRVTDNMAPVWRGRTAEPMALVVAVPFHWHG